MAESNGAPILQLEGVSKHFGGIAALTDVSFEVRRGEILGLIGPNGAGKTTAINVITGVYRPDSGAIKFDGEGIHGLRTDVITLKGLVRTFQLATFFPHLTVLDHLMITCIQQMGGKSMAIFLNNSSGRSIQKAARQRAEEMLEMMGLKQYLHSHPRELPTGYQRWLSLTMALSLNPKMLLLDEPLSGMNASEMDRTLALLKSILQERGISMLWVEHNMRAVMGTCDRIVVLNFGRKLTEGTPEAVRNDPAVIDAYLGGEDAAS